MAKVDSIGFVERRLHVMFDREGIEAEEGLELVGDLAVA